MTPDESVLGLVLLIGLGVFALWVRGRDESVVMPSSGSQEQTVEGLASAGRKIDAIKLYRKLHGVGLKEAKHAVEALEHGLPQ